MAAGSGVAVAAAGDLGGAPGSSVMVVAGVGSATVAVDDSVVAGTVTSSGPGPISGVMVARSSATTGVVVMGSGVLVTVGDDASAADDCSSSPFDSSDSGSFTSSRGICTVISGKGVGGDGGIGVAVGGGSVGLTAAVGVDDGWSTGKPGAVALGCNRGVVVMVGVAVWRAVAVSVGAATAVVAVGSTAASAALPVVIIFRTVVTAAWGAIPCRLTQVASSC